MDETFYEASVVEGLEAISVKELQNLLGSRFELLYPPGKWPGVLQFRYTGDLHHLFRLKTILAVFGIHRYLVPRPKAFLGHQNFQKLVEQLNAVRSLMPEGTYRTFYLAAAGSNSSVMLRLKAELADATGLTVSADEGDLLLRLRHPRDGREGWEAVIRMAPRPLSVREWRVCDYEGGLNAAVAHAMVLLTNPAPDDIFLNPACGSGTLLVERISDTPARLVIGCDLDPEAIRCANENIRAADAQSSLRVYPWDARFLPLRSNRVDVLSSDLPFGHDVGSHAENEVLYPQLLSETARVAKLNARFVLITHEVKLMNSLLEQSKEWIVDYVLPITLRGLHPRIYVLRRR